MVAVTGNPKMNRASAKEQSAWHSHTSQQRRNLAFNTQTRGRQASWASQVEGGVSPYLLVDERNAEQHA